MVVQADAAAMDRALIELPSFYADWLGSLGQADIPSDADRVAPVTGLGWHRARRLRKHKRFKDAALALLDELVLASHGAKPSRSLGYVLHEAGLVAEALGNDEAWEYFETMALIVYPNCHDALIGLALLSVNDLAAALPLLGRAYAIRPRQDELQLFGQTFARSDGRPSAQVRDQITACAAETRLDVPLYKDALGKPLAFDVDDVIRHLRALIQTDMP